MAEEYNFQRLQVYQLAMDYLEAVYALSRLLPKKEQNNLASQIEKAGTSIVLSIAEGSAGSETEQNRLLGHALRSYIETNVCCDLIERRGYLSKDALTPLREQGRSLFIRLTTFRKSLGRS